MKTKCIKCIPVVGDGDDDDDDDAVDWTPDAMQKKVHKIKTQWVEY